MASPHRSSIRRDMLPRGNGRSVAPLPVGAVLLMLMAGHAGSAAAQVSTGAGAAQGSLVGGRRSDIEFAVTGSTETNAIRLSPDDAASQGVERGDESVAPSVTFDVLRPIGRGSVFLSGTTAYSFYRNNTRLNRETSSISGGYGLSAAGCRAVLSGSYSRRLTELSTFADEPGQGQTTETAAQFDAVCGDRFIVSPTFSVTQGRLENSEGNSAGSNSETLGWSAGLAYQGLPGALLSGSILSQRTDFTDRPANSPGAQGYDLRGANVTLRTSGGARLGGSVTVGYTTIEPDNEPESESSTYDARLNYRAGSRLTIDGGASRRVVPSVQIAGSYRIEQVYEVRVRQKVGANYTVTVGASRQQGEEEGRSFAFPQDILNYETSTVFGSVSMMLRRFVLTLAVQNEDRQTNQPRLNYENTRTSIMLATRF